MKINILWQFKNEAWGGGNQFLKVLRSYFIDAGCYCEDPLEADVVLVNSKEFLSEAMVLKKRHSKICIHRIDGIFSIYRGGHERYNDLRVYDFTENYADGIIFQSNWSMSASKKNGMKSHNKEVVICNCSDPKIFYKTSCANSRLSSLVRLITTAWSDNQKKGFETYQYLDDNLDFNRYEYVFVGRSPLVFKNIKMTGVLTSEGIANELRKSDMFVTATEDDTCSNSLIEGLSCGLPAVALNSGGSSEIVKLGGEIYNSKLDIINKINIVADSLNRYRKDISINSIDVVGEQYFNFMKAVYEQKS